MDFDPDEIALTNGSMQAVTLVGRVLMDEPGDVVITEETTYSGTLGAYRGLGYRLVGVPLDEHGMDIGALRRTLESLTAAGEKPSFIYTLPTYHNPTGAVMPRERRLEMIEGRARLRRPPGRGQLLRRRPLRRRAPAAPEPLRAGERRGRRLHRLALEDPRRRRPHRLPRRQAAAAAAVSRPAFRRRPEHVVIQHRGGTSARPPARADRAQQRRAAAEA